MIDKEVIKTIALEESQSCDGAIYIGRCIRNRKESPYWPDTYKEVVLQRKQFSCNNEDANPRELTVKEIIAATDAWEASEYCNSPVNLYCRYDCHPDWDWTKVKFLVRIGSHNYYHERR